MKYSWRISVSCFKLFLRYFTASCIGSFLVTRQASPAFMAWLRVTIHDSSLGSRYFSAYHFRRMGNEPRFEKFKINLRHFVCATSVKSGMTASATVVVSYV